MRECRKPAGSAVSTMTTLTEDEVLRSGNSQIKREYIKELVQENPGISAIHRSLLTAFRAVQKEGGIAHKTTHGVMRYYTTEYAKKYNLFGRAANQQ